MNHLIEIVKRNIKSGIESERSRMNDEYDENIANIDKIEDIPSALKELVNIYGNNLEQRGKMIEILQDYLKADFFKDATIGRNGRSVVKGANNVFFNNGEYYVSFSTSRIYTIEVGRFKSLHEPNKTFKSVDPRIIKFIEMWNKFEEIGGNYDEVVDLYSILTRAKPAGIVYKMNPSLRLNMKEFAIEQEDEVRKFEELRFLWEQANEEFEAEKVVYKNILKELEGDLSSFSEAGWIIKYKG